MLKYFFAAAISFSNFEAGTGQRVPSSQLYPTQKVILEKEAPKLTDPRDGRVLEISAVTVPENEFIEAQENVGDQMCPVVRTSMVPSKTGLQIKPVYYTFQREDIVEVDVFANNGLVFTEFFLQAKDLKTNKTSGYWKVLDSSQEAYRCGERDLTQFLDTIRWRTPGETSKVRLQWVASFPGLPRMPEEVVIIGTFRTATGNYEHTVSKTLYLRDDISLKECCEHEITDDCSQMCTAANMVDSLSMATESCKMQIHKVQRCYLTGKTKDQSDPTENEIITKTDFMRKDCCAKESIDQKCLPFCADQSVSEWPLLVGECQHTLRQVTNCWTSTSCVNRCNGQWRGDYACQCDTDCTRRGDCCPDRDMSCRQSLPIELEYWKSNKVDCGYLPEFETLPEADLEKRISEATFEGPEEEPIIYGIQTDKAFVLRMTSYFFVRAKGTYKIFMMLGQRDTARVKIDNIEIFKSGCSWSELLDATIYLAGGGHQIVIEFTDTGYADQLKLAYSGPDTLRKPTQIPFERRDDILYMGPPPVVATPASTMTMAKKTTTTTAKTTTTTHELLSRPEIEHEIMSQNAVTPRYYATTKPKTEQTPFVFNPMHFPNNFHREAKNESEEEPKRDDLIISVVIINVVFLFIILAFGFLGFLKWRSSKNSNSTRPYNGKPSGRTSSGQQGRFAEAPSRIGSAVGSSASVTQEQLLEDLANSETKVKPKSNLMRKPSMKSTKSIISSRTVDCGVGTSPPMARKIDSFDSGVGLPVVQPYSFHVLPNQIYSNHEIIPNHYETLSLKSVQPRKLSIDSECHPDTLAKLNEISEKIKSRANSRAPSVKHLSVADEIQIENSEKDASRDPGASQKIKPISTDEENEKDDVTKSVGPLATDDEIRIRKTWHEARFKKNLSMRSSKRSRRKSKHMELSSDADNETEDDFSTIPSSHTPRFRSFSSEMMSEKPLRQASGTSFEFEDLPPPAPVPTKTITIECQPAKNSEKPLLSNFTFSPSLEANDQGGIKIGIYDAPPTPLFAKRALEFFAKEDKNCLGMQAMRFPKTEAEVEIKEEHISSSENSETEDSALGLDENSKSSDLKEKEAESLHQPSKTSLSAIQKAVSQTVTERVFDLLKEYKTPSTNQEDKKEEVKEEGNVLFERLVKKCLEA